MHVQTTPEFVSRKILAERLGLHPGTIYRLHKLHKIEGIKIGGSLRYNYPDILKSLREEKTK